MKVSDYDYIVDIHDIIHEYYNNNYKVSLTSQGITFLVNAESDGTALDAVMDYIVEQGLTDLYSIDYPNYPDEHICAGKNSYWFTTFNINIEEVIP